MPGRHHRKVTALYRRGAQSSLTQASVLASHVQSKTWELRLQEQMPVGIFAGPPKTAPLCIRKQGNLCYFTVSHRQAHSHAAVKRHGVTKAAAGKDQT